MSPNADVRCSALVKEAARRGFDAVLVTRPENVHYLTGFTGEDSWLLVTRRRRLLITDGRFTEEAAISAPSCLVHRRKGAMAEEAAGILLRSARRTAFDSLHLTAAAHAVISKRLRPPAKLLAAPGLVERLRLVKDAFEISAVRKAVKAAEAGFRETLARAGRNWSETDFAAALEYAMRRHGAQRAAFDTIAAAEPFSSLPHAKPGPASIYAGSTLLVDWGARVSRYNCDLTRVVAWGKVAPRIDRIWRVVKAARKAALMTIKAGVAAATVDAAARRVIADAGYAEFFGHGLGHGVGLEVHEGPHLSPGNKTRLKSGMIVTVEPGIYLPEIGGVRLEDLVLVTAGGAKVLTGMQREPARLGALARGRASLEVL